MLLREVLGEALRSARQTQRRTLRELSAASTVSLGYLSEIERGQKEASSELLAAICDALGISLSDVLREAGHQLDHAALPPVTLNRACLASVTPMPRANGPAAFGVDTRAHAHAA
jgi:transcriptional regulator with XRE-family HTH domain